MTQFEFYFKGGKKITTEELVHLAKEALSRLQKIQGKIYKLGEVTELGSPYTDTHYQIKTDTGHLDFSVWNPSKSERLSRQQESYLVLEFKFQMEMEDYVKTPLFLEAIRFCYGLVKFPGCGFQDVNPDYEPREFRDKLFEYQEAILYERIWGANLFTPEEVKRLGRDRLLRAPCERIEEWPDGAIFMMVRKDDFSTTYDERKRLREYLGIRGGL